MATRAQTPRAPRQRDKKSARTPLRTTDLDPEGELSHSVPSNGNPPNRQTETKPTPALGFDPATQTPSVIGIDQFDKLISALKVEGYEVIGPTVRDGAISYESVRAASDLPAGWTDEQAPGRFRLQKSESPAFFGYTLGAQSWKPYLHAAEVRLFAAERQNGCFRILNNDPAPPVSQAFLGVRACELAAIFIQDRVLLGDKYRDAVYAWRREKTFIVAVQCTRSAATCFCASAGFGPRVGSGFDLLLTELIDVQNHRFLVEAGSERGAKFLAQLDSGPAPAADVQAANAAVASAARQERKLDATGLKEFLYDNFENPRWDKVAARCLSCANCTMVCPTCFCTTVEDVTDVGGTHGERWRRWDSCFTQSFSHIHGGSIRTSAKARYRQWMTHKLAAWQDQFGSIGCVGCGRCITWCPVGIDITEEVRAMREGGARADS